MKKDIVLYDTTLRDGEQAEGISFSVEDKVGIGRKLDAMGFDYLEGGWPGSNPRAIDPSSATAATTRALIRSSDERHSWGTVGVSENIIEAAWAALIDSVEYKLLRDEDEARRQRAEIRPQRKKKTTKGKQENK